MIIRLLSKNKSRMKYILFLWSDTHFGTSVQFFSHIHVHAVDFGDVSAGPDTF